MTATPRITLASDEQFEARLRSAMPELNGNLNRLPGVAWTEGEPVDRLLAEDPQVVAFGPGLPLERVLAAAAEIDRKRPTVEVVVVADPSPALWKEAARSGVREVVAPAADDAELAGAVRRLCALVEERNAGRGAAGPGQPADAVVDHRAVVVVRSPKGGAGKTMVASNLAVSLARTHPGEVVLVDLDLQFGDAATALGLQPTSTIADAVARPELTATALKALLASHGDRLAVLCAPAVPAEADDIAAEDVSAVLALLQEAFRFVVVDTAGGLDEPALAALDAATDVILICSMDVSSVRALHKELAALDVAGITAAQRHVVLNRANSRVGLELGDIEAAIGTSVHAHIGSSRSVPLHMNCGVPMVEAEPSSPVARQLEELAARVVPRPAAGRGRAWRRRR